MVQPTPASARTTGPASASARTTDPASASVAAPASGGSAPVTATVNRSRRRRTLWVLQILIALFLLVGSALPKLVGQEDAVETFTKLGWDEWTRYAVGLIEAAGAIGLVVPRLAGLAATGLIGLMIGAILTQLFVLVPAFAVLPAAFAVVFALIAYDRRVETRELLRSFRR